MLYKEQSMKAILYIIMLVWLTSIMFNVIDVITGDKEPRQTKSKRF